MDMLSEPVLVLNTGYLPIGVRSVKDAICLMLLEKAEAVKSKENSYIRSARLQIPVPQIIVLANYFKIPRRINRVTRQNILERDNYSCVYCGKQPGNSKLTLDHVIPRSRWEEIQLDKKPKEFHSWENIVTACRECNTRKGNKLLSELRWKLPENKKMDYKNGGLHISRASAEKYGWSEYLYNY